MKKFNCVCVDSLTGYEIVLADASYNNVCFYIENQLGAEIKKIISDYHTNRTTIHTTNRTFIYDENRGYLLVS